MSRRVLWAALLLGLTLSLAASCALATFEIVLGSREGGWAYTYIDSFSGRSIEVFLIVSVFAAALLSKSWSLVSGPAPVSRSARGDWMLVIGWCVLALALQALIRSLTPFTFAAIFANDTANSFYTVALRYDAASILREFERSRLSWPLHARSNLPGKLLLVRGLTHVSTNPEALAWLTVFISNLGAVPLFAFVRDLFKDRRVALLSVVLYLFMPAKLYFFPLLNTVTPAAVLVCSFLCLRWLTTKRPVYAALLGVALYGLVLYEPLALAIGLLFAALIARALWLREITFDLVLRHAALGLFAFAATYSIVALGFGFDLARALREVAADAAKFNAVNARPYALWVRENPIEFAFGVGVCQAVLFWAALADGLGGSGPIRRRLAEPIAVLSLAILATLAVIDFVGVNRGEVIRLWIFLGCLFQVPAAYVCSRIDNRAAVILVLIAALLQGALGASMVGFIVPG